MNLGSLDGGLGDTGESGLHVSVLVDLACGHIFVRISEVKVLSKIGVGGGLELSVDIVLSMSSFAIF